MDWNLTPTPGLGLGLNLGLSLSASPGLESKLDLGKWFSCQIKTRKRADGSERLTAIRDAWHRETVTLFLEQGVPKQKVLCNQDSYGETSDVFTEHIPHAWYENSIPLLALLMARPWLESPVPHKYGGNVILCAEWILESKFAVCKKMGRRTEYTDQWQFWTWR